MTFDRTARTRTASPHCYTAPRTAHAFAARCAVAAAEGSSVKKISDQVIGIGDGRMAQAYRHPVSAKRLYQTFCTYSSGDIDTLHTRARKSSQRRASAVMSSRRRHFAAKIYQQMAVASVMALSSTVASTAYQSDASMQYCANKRTHAHTRTARQMASRLSSRRTRISGEMLRASTRRVAASIWRGVTKRWRTRILARAASSQAHSSIARL